MNRNCKKDPNACITDNVKGIIFHSAAKSLQTVCYGREALPRRRKTPSLKRMKVAISPTPPEASSFSARRFVEEDSLDMEKVRQDDSYWESAKEATPLTKLLPLTPNHLSSDKSSTEKIVLSKLVPKTDCSLRDFWGKVMLKNPNKNSQQYFETFAQNVPLPVIHKHEVKYTFDGSKLYLRILLLLLNAPFLAIHEDNPHLLRLIADNIIVFEVHWRKMVVDIRTGKLNRRLEINDALRAIYESKMHSNEANAAQLDIIFRKLGFHKKAIGKDIPSQQLAQLKAGHSLTEKYDPFDDDSNSSIGTGENLGLKESVTTLETSVATFQSSTCDNYIAPIRMLCGKFVCPCPGCGRSFNAKLAATMHIHDHEKTKISMIDVPLPLNDVFYEPFWPANNPWAPQCKGQMDPTFIPADAVFCPAQNCTEHFRERSKLAMHMKLMHPKYDARVKYKGEFFTFYDAYPAPALETLGLFVCKKHLEKAFRNCQTCQHIERRADSPKPPYAFYNSLEINFPVGENDRILHYSRSDTEKGIEFMMRSSKAAARIMRGFCREFLVDRNKKAWVYVLELCTQEEAIAKRLRLPHDFDAAYELLPIGEGTGGVWISLDNATQDIEVMHMPKYTFRLEIKQRSRRRGVYFIRPEVDAGVIL